MPGRRIWHVLLVAPLAVPAFVNSYAWISLLPGLDTYAGALLVVSLSYFPFVYLPVAAAFRGLDPALEETARGPGPVQLGGVPPGAAAAAAGRAARRQPAGRAAPARRVRRAADAALPDLHHRDLRPVPRHLQRPGRHDAGRRPGAALPASCCWPRSGCAGGAATRAPAAAPPGRSGRSRLRRPHRARRWLGARRPWSSWPWSCRWPASATGWRAGASTGLDWAALATTTGTTLGLAAAAAVGDHRDGAAHRAGSPSAPGAGSPPCSSAAPTSAARCRASSSPWRW